MGHTWESFTHHDFFRPIDFEALERKEIDPVFVPSSEKTNFDATYDLEELLLEEAPLEARARRQKPREKLKDDATDKEIREDELYRMIDTDFKPFDYTVAAYRKWVGSQPVGAEVSRTDYENRIVEPCGDDGATLGSNGAPASHQGQALTTDDARPLSQATTITNGGYPGRSGPPLVPSKSSESGHGKSSKSRGLSGRPAPLPPYPNSYTNSKHGSKGGFVQSPTGGVSVTLDGGGSWSDLARQDATLPADAAQTQEGGKIEAGSGGVFGFLSRKKGRGNSPKPKERGVLGKEGARVVIG